jgi:PleD family two-component response regulator
MLRKFRALAEAIGLGQVKGKILVRLFCFQFYFRQQFHSKITMPTILIIDDEPAIRKALREILEYESFEVKEAEDGAAALKLVEKENLRSHFL